MLQNRRYDELMSAKSVPLAPLGPWAGVDTVRLANHRVFQQPEPSENRLPFLRSAVNVDIDDDGWVTTRDTWELIDDARAHSLFEYNGETYAVVDGVVSRLTATAIHSIGAALGPVSWSVLNGRPIYTDGRAIRIVTGSGTEGLPASENAQNMGEDLDLEPLPGGNAIAYWNGRLVVAKRSELCFSEPMRYGVYDNVRGRMFFERPIEWLAALETGLYVGLDDSVRFLRGTSPLEMEQDIMPGKTGGGRVIPSTGLPNDITEGAPSVVVWFSDRGFAFGAESGKVVYPQQDNIRDLSVSRCKISFYNDRLTAIFD